MQCVVTLHDKTTIEAFARKNTFLHLFELADLDDRFWPHTAWYGRSDAGSLDQLALIYTALSPPVLLAYPHPPSAHMRDFLHALLPLLPRALYAHLDPSCVDVLGAAYDVAPQGPHWKMGLINQSRLGPVPEASVTRLSARDLDRLERFYAEASPDMVLNRRMVEAGCYYGIQYGSRLVSVAGVHASSPTYKVAVLGNIATHPDFRRQGFGRSVCAAVCRRLSSAGMSQVGLNVRADNTAAIRLYQQLGFEKVGEFGAYHLRWQG